MRNAECGMRNHEERVESSTTPVAPMSAGVLDLPHSHLPFRIPQSAFRILLIGVVLGWFALLILVPTIALVRQALAGGLRPFFEALASTDVRRAFGLTLGIT